MKPRWFTLSVAVLAILLGIYFIVGAQVAGIEKASASLNSSVASVGHKSHQLLKDSSLHLRRFAFLLRAW